MNTDTQQAALSQELTQQTYEEQLAERIAAQNVAEAKERGIPLWMLTGFPAQSSEPDEDDPIDFQ